ncbi:MAG TPA: deaminase [Candidatus Saccharimonadales bacterium]
MQFDWSELAFSSKKPLRKLSATFIAAPRELSAKRFTQLVKAYLPAGNIVVGLAKEAYIDGFNGQPQFKTLNIETIQPIIDKVNTSASKCKIHTLHYFQRELPFVLEKIGCKQALFMNGSWHRSIHTRPEFYTLVKLGIPYRLLSPFCDEAEARAYAARVEVSLPSPTGAFSEQAMLSIADQAAACSFDYSFQTGVALGKKLGKTYELLAAACNNVVPYQTYAMHHGASRELHFSPPNDLNYYDAVHAEMALLVKAQKMGLNLQKTTLFINLLPCPTCARMLTQTDIEEFIYQADHSAGYAIKMLELAGKKVRRIVK